MQKSLIIFIIGLIVVSFGLGLTFAQREESFSLETANDRAMSFINEVLLAGQSTASLVDISKDHGLIKIDIDIEGQPYTSYMTNDMQLFFIEGMNIDEYTQLAQSNQRQEIQAPSESQNLPLNLDEFVSCLSEHEMLVYGADWCGYTNQLVDLFGGFEMIDPIYVECTQEEALCQEAQIAGYPTIRFSGEDYSGPRTLENFAETTGCQLVY